MEGRIGNAFACERCRKHKVRCVPSDVAGICQRCQKARVDCVEHVARRRPAKPRSAGIIHSSSRLSDMGTKMETLSSIVTTSTSNSTTSTTSSAPAPAPQSQAQSQPSQPPPPTMTRQIPDVAQRTPTPVNHAPKVSLRPNPASASPETALSFWESINETISGLGRLDPVLRTISVIHMELLVESFQRMVDYFPFVVMPTNVPVRVSMVQRPVLMFAVLTAASYDSALLQLSLSREFRKVVMVKVMNGEKSLDLLQGLLVFIAWHHHYMDPQGVSMHMLLQMCIGMAADLGLDRLVSSYQLNDPRERESKRAYLGCYYLSCSLRLVELGRPQCLAYTPVIRKYASELFHFRERGSDQILPSLVDTCRLLEDVEATFSRQPEQVLVAKSQTKRLEENWESIRKASQHLAAEFKTLQWLQLAARVYISQQSVAMELTDRDSVPWAAGYQLSLRIGCLRHIEEFLDSSLRMNTSQYECLSIVDWVHLLSTLTVLGKLALHSASIPGWDPTDLQLAKTFQHFRDQLCAQMPRPLDSPDRKAENVFDRFRRVTDIMKRNVKPSAGRSSPGSGSTFEITTSSRQTVSLLQESPMLPKPNGVSNGVDLPPPWKANPSYDITSDEFTRRFLLGTI